MLRKSQTAEVHVARLLTSLFTLSLVLASGAGCFSTPQAKCAFECGSEGQCPSDYFCAADHWCKLEGTAQSFDCGLALVDAASVDAVLFDAKTSDASTPDSNTVVCGDGAIELPETCDDGNVVDDGNGCDAQCQRNDVCGNNTIEALFEQCDDANAVDDGNGCDALCQRNDVCGNGTLESLFETCDDGNTDACGTCSAACDAALGGADCATGVGCVAPEDCLSGVCSAGLCT